MKFNWRNSDGSDGPDIPNPLSKCGGKRISRIPWIATRLRYVSSKTLNSAYSFSLIILPPELCVLSPRRLADLLNMQAHIAISPPGQVRLDRPPPQRTGNWASIGARLRSIMADHERLVSTRSSSGVILDWTAEQHQRRDSTQFYHSWRQDRVSSHRRSRPKDIRREIFHSESSGVIHLYFRRGRRQCEDEIALSGWQCGQAVVAVSSTVCQRPPSAQ